MKIIRVFPTKTALTPEDDLSFVGLPTLFIPKHDRVHVSVTFTWDIEEGYFLRKQWENITDKPVLIGGPAFDDMGGEFTTGRYLKDGVVVTSRGCPNNCSYCFVPEREGEIRELDIKDGNIIQDNNFLACSDNHKADVFDMLSKQKGIRFSGGLEASRVDLTFVKELKKLSITEVWLACDTPQSFKLVKKKIKLLRSEGIPQYKIRCYVIIGKDQQEEEKRLKNLYNSGCLPFAQLYQPKVKTEYSKEWKRFQRFWTRPAIYKSTMRM